MLLSKRLECAVQDGGTAEQVGTQDRARFDPDARLAGTLPCAQCGYNMHGLTIRGVCPECGLAVRATILHRLDPLADEFAPVVHRRVLALGLLLWPSGAALAALIGWVQVVVQLTRSTTGLYVDTFNLGAAFGLAGGISMAGALTLVRPTEATPLWKSLLALSTALWYAIGMYAGIRLISGSVLVSITSRPSLSEAVFDVALGLSLGMICLSLRPTARELVRRSMVLRTKRVDRQTLVAMMVASAVVVAGQSMRLAWALWGDIPFGSALGLVGQVLSSVAWMLLTLGLISAVIDSVWIAEAVLRPSLSPKRLLDGVPADKDEPS